MAQTQGKSGNAQTVEKAKTHISEPAETEQSTEERLYG